jgi:hypothetical protein
MKAFPWVTQRPDGVVVEYNSGMDLRDYFAAKAMEQVRFQYTADAKNIQVIDAEFCYMIADAMMEAREK